MPQYRRKAGWGPLLFALSLIWLGPTLACGSFAPRPTATPLSAQVPNLDDSDTADSQPTVVQALPTPSIQEAPTPTIPPLPTPTFTPTPQPGTALSIGQPARVAAPNGLNLRDAPSTGGQLILQLGTNQRVTIVEGPVSADGYTWWRMDDGQGNVGWGADGDGETVWLSPSVGEPLPVTRSPRVGDRVAVTMDSGLQLTLRALPGTDAPLITRVNPGTEFTIVAGPQSANGYTWYQIRSDDGLLEGWAADGSDNTRWLSPLE